MKEKKRKKWKIELKYDDINKLFELFDTKSIYKEYFVLQRIFFEDLLNTIKKNKKFGVKKGINQVISYNDEDWTKNPWILVISKEKQTNIPFWFLFLRDTNLTGTLVAVGPSGFFNYCLSTKKEKKKLWIIIEDIIRNPQNWILLSIIPNLLKIN